MQNIFIDVLPPWVETGLQPAFYDLESGTVLQQTARMYARVRELNDAFNQFSEDVSTEINNFEYETNTEIERFEQATNDEIERFEGVINDTVEEYIGKFNDLHDYVEDYFENLDVQEEINNKLDDMVEQGTLQEIITTYIQSNVAWTFDSVAEMQSATNLTSDSYAQTYGFYAVNDGGGALYKIRELEEDETADGIFTISLYDASLVAELQYSKVLNIKTLGCKADKSADCSAKIQAAIDKLDDVTLYFPHGAYLMNTAITSKAGINYLGQFKHTYTGLSDEGLFFDGTNGFTGCTFNRFKGMLIQNETYDGTQTSATNSGITIVGNDVYVENCTFARFIAGINCNYHAVICSTSSFHDNGLGIYNPVDARIVNCTLNAQVHSAIMLLAGSNDNIISDNKIEWNYEYGIAINGSCYHCTITNNILDRNGQAGIHISGASAKNVISNNILRRNGALSSGTDSANIRINTAYNNIITGNTTAVNNSQDDGSGTLVPLYSLYAVDTGDNLLSLINNDLTGGTNSNPVYLERCRNVYRLDNVSRVYDNLLISSTQETANGNGGTAVFTIPFDKEPASYVMGYYKKLVITTRDVNDANIVIKEVYIYFYKQYGNLKAMLTESTLMTDVGITATYDTDHVAVTVTNNKSGNLQVKVNIYSC